MLSILGDWISEVGVKMSYIGANRITLCLVGILLALAGTAVDGSVIYVDAEAPCGNGDFCWPDAHKYLQDALAEAISLPKPVEIRVAGGVYWPDESAAEPNGTGDRTATFQLINGVTIVGGYAGSGEADPNVRDLIAYETILSGDLDGNDVEFEDVEYGSVDNFVRGESRRHENSYTVVIGSGTDGTAVLDGFTITGGHANGPILGECPDVDYRYRAGGGMYNDSGSPTLVRCTFRWNAAESFDSFLDCSTGDYPGVSFLPGTCGGGICNRDSSPTLEDCSFEENVAFGANEFSCGGGMFNVGSNPTLTNCNFLRNVATGFDSGYSGGAMYNDNSNAVLTDCSFVGNTTIYGGPGGLSNSYNSNGTLTRCTFDDNEGGGMSITQSSPTLTDCGFSGNSGLGLDIAGYSMAILTNCTFTENLGSGVAISGNSEPTLTGCTFMGNSADDSGGGIHNWYGGNPMVIGCKFFGNTAVYSGGAVYNDRSNPMLINCVFSGNRAMGTSEWSGGGGIYNDDGSDVVLINCTFAGNLAPRGNAVGCRSYGSEGPSIVRGTNCIFRDGGDEVWNDDGSTIVITYSDVAGDWPGVGNIDADPLFADADGPDNVVGTEDDDLRPVGGSPCIDAGDNSAVPDSVETDIAGRVRIMNGTVDMGAHESQSHIYVDTVNGDDSNDGLTRERAFATIQRGINSAVAGYRILVYPGVYSESITFTGIAMTVIGAEDAPILEASGGYGASFYLSEGRDSVLKNFVIRNSSIGIYTTSGASPTIKNVTLVGNDFGVVADNGISPDISNCIFWDNMDDLYQCNARYSWVQDDIEEQPVVGLICHWGFDEGGGAWAYDSVGDSDLSLFQAGWTTGVIGGALNFDGGASADAQDQPGQQIHTNQVTVSAWIKLNGEVGNDQAGIISKQANAGNSWALSVFGEGYSGSTGNQIVFRDSDGISQAYAFMSETDLVVNQWHHICVTDNAGSIRIYLNGELDSSSEDGFGIPSEISASIRVGAIGSPGYFNGLIDDIRVYDRAVGVEDIANLHENGFLGYGSLADPFFADAAGGDYHLRSERGRYWPEHDLWVLDTVTSPCIDIGDPNDSASGERTPNGGKINIGAYGGTGWASMSECWSRADYNCDGVVNMMDFADVADKWLEAAEWFE